MFLVFVPVVHEVENAMSLLQKYSSAYWVTVPVEVVGEVMEKEAEPVGER
jgi:hypothetical protein